MATEVADQVVLDDEATAQSDSPKEPALALVCTSDGDKTREILRRGLEELARRVGPNPVYDLAKKDDVERAKADRQLCRDVVSAINDAYDRWNHPLLDARAANIKSRDDALCVAEAVRDHIDDQLKADARRKAAEKAERDRKEQERVMGHRVAIASISAIPNEFTRSSVDDIQAKLDEVSAPTYLASREWEEFAPQAKDAVDAAVTLLRAHLESAQNRARLAQIEAQQKAEAEERERAENARRAEQARVAGIRERIDGFNSTVRACVGMDSVHIERQIGMLEAEDTADGSYAEFEREAGEAKLSALRDLGEMLAQVQANEDAAAAQKRTQAIFERIQSINGAMVRVQSTKTVAEAEAIQRELERIKTDASEFGDMAQMATITRDTALQAVEKHLADLRAALARKLQEDEAQRVAQEQAAKEQTRRDAEAQELARLNTELKENAAEALAHLRAVTAYAKEEGHAWLCLTEAEAFINRIDPEGKL